MLFGKVTDYNVRSRLRMPASPAKTEVPRGDRDFQWLDRVVGEAFLTSLPPEYGHCLGANGAMTGSRGASTASTTSTMPPQGVGMSGLGMPAPPPPRMMETMSVDTDLYMVHLIPHA